MREKKLLFKGMPKLLEGVINALLVRCKGKDLSNEKLISNSTTSNKNHRGLNQELLVLRGCAFGCRKDLYDKNLDDIKSDKNKYSSRKDDANVNSQWIANGKTYYTWNELAYENEFENFIKEFNLLYLGKYEINCINPKEKNKSFSLSEFTEDEASEKEGPKRMIPPKNVMQKIFFGAPGTGKSFKVNAILGENRKNCFSKSDHHKSNGYANDLCDVKNVGFDVWSIDNIEFLEKKLVSFESDNKVTNPRHSALRAYIDFFKKYREENRENRTTFHPDYDYAQFVGAYKPKKEGEKITYSFVPQVFAKAYTTAWKQYFAAGNTSTADNQVYLVIEEINRGNCAQIFGDIFQLLDRDSEGFSQYSIDADCDFAEWLKTNDNGLKSVWSAYEKKVGDGKLKLPPNLNILATMNTSDQSLFPMDSAFKRRFDWEYVPIKYAKDSDCGDDWEADKFQVVVDKDFAFNWLHFLKKVNADIYKVAESEDKQMGEFFIKPKSGNLTITRDEFRSKVLFYLWDSVYKDEVERKVVFRFDHNGTDVTFQRLFADDFSAILKKMLQNLDEAYNSDEFKGFKILDQEKESENQ